MQIFWLICNDSAQFCSLRCHLCWWLERCFAERTPFCFLFSKWCLGRYRPFSRVVVFVFGDHSSYGLSQWETTLHRNVVSQWLSPCPDLGMNFKLNALFVHIKPMFYNDPAYSCDLLSFGSSCHKWTSTLYWCNVSWLEDIMSKQIYGLEAVDKGYNYPQSPCRPFTGKHVVPQHSDVDPMT